MEKIDMQNLPRHIAVIMDGNGRWAQKHAMGRVSGHKKGAEAVRVTVKTCREIGIEFLTLYALSVENLQRPSFEVKALMDLLQDYLRSELDDMLANNIRLKTIGRTASLSGPVKELLRDVMARTAANDGMVLTLALSYGGRDEIIGAVKNVVGDVQAGRLGADDISGEMFESYLDTRGMPEPDLLIRTSGEYRISNFLLWQMAYTEFHFTDVLWPDFGRADLMEAIADYQRRERRFGLTTEQLNNKR